MQAVLVALVLLCCELTAFGFHGITSSFSRTHSRSKLSMGLSPVVGGSVVALVTPMHADRSVDYAKLVEILEWHKSEGTDGAVILGTTGEASMINAEERAEIIKTAVKTVNKKFPVIIGTGTIETQKVIALNKQALELGADAALVITPYYIKPPPRALVKHFLTIADACPLPIVLYNCPGRTGVDMKPETVALLASHPSIVGLKDATGDLDRVAALRALNGGKDFLLFSGEDDQGCDFVRMGGDGVISVTANICPALEHQMLELSKAGKRVEAEAINAQLMRLHKSLFLEANPIGAKKALFFMGKIQDSIREPLDTLAPEHFSPLQEALMLATAM